MCVYVCVCVPVIRVRSAVGCYIDKGVATKSIS